MSKPATKRRVVARRNPQLQSLNEKIARMVALKPWHDIYRSFSFAAQLTDQAIKAAEDLRQMPGIDTPALEPILTFWYQVRDYNGAAALAVAGGNQTLAEALVTLRFLQVRFGGAR